jgi:hypothetical protein
VYVLACEVPGLCVFIRVFTAWVQIWLCSCVVGTHSCALWS